MQYLHNEGIVHGDLRAVSHEMGLVQHRDLNSLNDPTVSHHRQTFSLTMRGRGMSESETSASFKLLIYTPLLLTLVTKAIHDGFPQRPLRKMLRSLLTQVMCTHLGVYG